MEYLVTAEEMRRYDKYTSENLKVPDIVLMERAASGACNVCEEFFNRNGLADARVIVLCGYGNNGGDGIALARMLVQHGYEASVVLVGDPDKASRLNLLEQEIAQNYKIPVRRYALTEFSRLINDIRDEGSSDVVYVDAIFGVGLSRPLSGGFSDLIYAVNSSGAPVIALDIPSGVNADGARASDPAIDADLTLSFGFLKVGQILYPGASHCGEVVRVDMGIDEYSISGASPVYRRIDSLRDIALPERNPDSNKGTYGKILIIAGSRDIYGAAFLAAKAAFETGAGMVKMITHVNNRTELLISLPDAMYSFYDDDTPDDELDDMTGKAVSWCDVILIGPGIGMGRSAAKLVSKVMLDTDKPVLVDADAIRICSADEQIKNCLRCGTHPGIVMTPHPGEFSCMSGKTVMEIKDSFATLPLDYVKDMHVTLVCKDARSMIVSYGCREAYVNTTGNDGMAVAGSGDVLSGICAVLMAQMGDCFDAAALAAYIHGSAGDIAASKKTKRALRAIDIIDAISEAMDGKG